jgi:hypothetical protein
MLWGFANFACFLPEVYMNTNAFFKEKFSVPFVFFLKQVKEKNGVTRWKQVKVNLEDHIHIPSFPPNLELYDDYVNSYMSKTALSQLPQSRPLWEIHIIKYPTKTAQGIWPLPAIVILVCLLRYL